MNDRAKFITGLRWHDVEGASSPVLSRSFMPVQDLASGGTLELLMAPKPSTTFGVAERDRPTSAWQAPGFVAVPSVSAPRTFQEDAATFELGHLESGATLEWSADGGATWRVYSAPVEVTETTDLLARSVLGADTSAVVSHRILKVDHAWQLSLETPPDNQYAAGGDQALIDGLQGGDDFRTGEWQGYWGKNASPPWIWDNGNP